MAIYYYRWDDVGAPVMGSGSGGIIPVLDACLVNGYGSKASMGWTQPFATTSNVAVYKMPALYGGYYFRVDADNHWFNAYRFIGYYYKASSFLTMTDLNNGTGRLPAVGSSQDITTTGDVWGCMIHDATQVSPPRWILTGGDDYFHLIIEGYNTSAGVPFNSTLYIFHFFYGNLENSPNHILHNLAMYSGQEYNSGNPTGYQVNYLISNTTSSYYNTNIKGTNYPLFMHSDSANNNNTTTCQSVINTVLGNSPFPNNENRLVLMQKDIYDSYNNVAATIPYEYRGRLPGIYYIPHLETTLTSSGYTPLDTFSDGVNTYLYLVLTFYTAAAYRHPIALLIG